MHQAGTLFGPTDLNSYLSHRRTALIDDIERYAHNQFLNTPPAALREYFLNKYRLDAPVLRESEITAGQAEAMVDVSQYPDRLIHDRSRPIYRPGVKISLYVPFNGDEDVLYYTPSTRFMSGPVRAHIEQHQIVVEYLTDVLEERGVRQWRDEILSTIRQYVGWAADDVRGWNRGIDSTVNDVVEARRGRLLQSQGLVESLGFPLAPRPNAPRTYAVSNVVRKPIQPPSASSGVFVPEPALAAAQFEEILSLLRPVGATIERDPAAFASLDEESLRSLFLATLNSHFKGRATGETFNAQGKTDILIRENDRNIFIAECKVWRGAKSFNEALNQVLSYGTWRDGKLALLIFVRQKRFTEVVQQIPDLIRGHESFRRALEVIAEAEWRSTVASTADPGRECTLAVIAFHVSAA